MVRSEVRRVGLLSALAAAGLALLVLDGIGRAADAGGKGQPAAVSDVAAAYRASFWHLIVPTGAMTADRDELVLRYQACDLAHEIAFLTAVAKLEITKEQAEKLLPSARKARELCEERASYMRDACKAYYRQCDVVRDNNISILTGCDRELLETKIGKLEGMCGPPGYGLGWLDHPVREKFYHDMAALGSAAEEEVLSAAQRETLKEARAQIEWIDLPAHTRREVWSNVTDQPTNVPLGTMGRLFMAPNAVSWLERAAGQAHAASVKRAAAFQPLGAEVAQLRRDAHNYSLRLVDGPNIFSGLNFTDKQLTSLIDLLQGEVSKIHAAHAELNKKSLRLLVGLLKEMRDRVAAGKGLADDQMQQVVEYQKGICRGNYVEPKSNDTACQFRGVFCPMHGQYTDGMMAVFKRLEDESIISTAQCKLLYDTNQCDWFPPKNYRDPVRVGQAAKGITYPEHAVLARLRSLEQAEYVRERDEFARDIVTGILSRSRSSGAREQETVRVTGALDKLRTMPDALYELNKYNLLAQLLERPCPETTEGTGALHASRGKIEDLTWDTKFYGAAYDWSPWDFMKAMEAAGKPLPRFSDKPVRYCEAGGPPMFLQEWPAHFLMDPAFVPALETLRTIARLPETGGATDLDMLKKPTDAGREVGSR